MTAGRFFEVLAPFLARYGIFLLFWIVAILIQVRRVLRWRSRGREIADPSLTPGWTERRASVFTGGVRGNWEGRAATLRRFPSTDRSRETVETTLQTAVPGRFLIERGGAAFFERQLRIGAPPPIEPMSPADRDLFRIRASDRTLTDRLLADAPAKAALLDVLQGPSDEVSLSKGRLCVRRRFPRKDAAGPVIARSLKTLEEMSRVLG